MSNLDKILIHVPVYGIMHAIYIINTKELDHDDRFMIFQSGTIQCLFVGLIIIYLSEFK